MGKQKVLILIGGEYHDYKGCGEILATLLTETGYLPTVTEDRNALLEQNINKYDACVFYTSGGKLDERQTKGLTDFVKSGKGFVGLHGASASFVDNKEYIDMIGAKFFDHPPVCAFNVNITDPNHLTSRRIESFTITDELYLMKYDASKIHIIMSAYNQGKYEPMAYCKEYGKGRVYYFALGHSRESFLNPDFQKIAIRAIKWSMACEEEKEIRAGVIGCGGMGNHHCKVASSIPGLKLTAGCDCDKQRLENVKKEYPGIYTCTDVEEFLKKSKIDLAIIVLPHNVHAEVAIKCANAGKHVIVEKPMCITANEATRMINASKKYGTMLSVYHNRRWDVDYLVLKEIMKRDLIGNIYKWESYIGGLNMPGPAWRNIKSISGGLFYDWGAHLVDWMLGVIKSKVVSVRGYAHKNTWHNVDIEDEVEAVLNFENGAVGNLQISNIARAQKPKWRILGDKGSVLHEKWFDPSEQFVTVFTDNKGMPVEIKVPYEGPFQKFLEQWKSFYNNIADHLLIGEPLAVTAESARRVIAVLESAEKSARTDKEEIVPY